MLRRNFSAVAALKGTFHGAAAMQLRFGGGSDNPSKYDNSHTFSRSLSAEEQQLFAAQTHNRPVNAIVPGKMFMRHFIAGEQATVSVYNRAISWAVTFFLVFGGSLYVPMGFGSDQGTMQTSMAVLFATFIITHTHLNLWPTFCAVTAVSLLFLAFCC